MGMVGHCFTGGVFIDVLNICGLGAKPPHMLWDSNFFRGFLFFFLFLTCVLVFTIVTASCFYKKKIGKTKLILNEKKKKRDLCLGRVSLEEVKRAGGCGADLLNLPRAPILRLCSGPPSVQARSRTLQSS